ncbi:hypothetical protein NDN92_24865 [Burkholderia glumae]|uniref:Uncharacterized protein n=1 Tax=Burkholderia glumae TaxID=337 RepID=A0ABY5B7C6_BURGL|nr:hypothetical protein [Burkholderia glumae]KHJ62191.1 hypothetical protein NCPPB3923_14840 [Burkholderia glumae]MCM2485133.1 hypothetical protein [Burkholderia glumae]MCM2510826.1 hypothetical protein [Burkholderia glumae]MCM2540662.1 hypothetical protein [Burkholderia glumae]MCM2552176.1 hypothetical protein [Burkholderia glumae]
MIALGDARQRALGARAASGSARVPMHRASRGTSLMTLAAAPMSFESGLPVSAISLGKYSMRRTS